MLYPSLNKLKHIAKMQNLSQNDLYQITKILNLSRNELEQIEKMRRIKNYKNMSKEGLLIALLKSESSKKKNTIKANQIMLKYKTLEKILMNQDINFQDQK